MCRRLAFLALALLQAGAVAQTSASTDRSYLQSLLRRKGIAALIDEITQPGREVWNRIKAGLIRPNGWYFLVGVKSALLPELSGTLISQTATELVLGVSDPEVPDLTLKLDAPIQQHVERGGKVFFVGVARDYTRQPFMLVVDVRRTDLSFLAGCALSPNGR